MNLVMPSLSLMCIFLLAFWPSSAQSLVLCQPVRLKPACLGISRGAVAMLQEFSRRGKKWADKPGSNFREGSSAELEFAHGRSGVQPTVENLPEDRHGSGGFCGGFFWSQNTKEKPAE